MDLLLPALHADLSHDLLEESMQNLSPLKGDRLFPLVMDITDESQLLEKSRKLAKQGLQVNVLINNAARNPKIDKNNSLSENSRVEFTDMNEWNLDFDVGLKGAFMCTKVFGSIMASQQQGNIINIASDLGVIAPDQRLYQVEGRELNQQPVKPASYSAIKHGIVGLTKYFATYWAAQNVRCNSLSPAGVYNGQPKDFVDRITKLIPMNRMAKTEDLQGPIVFLASDASSYMTGTNLIVDGGRTCW